MVKVLSGLITAVDTGLSAAGSDTQHQSGGCGRAPASVSWSRSVGDQVDVLLTSHSAPCVARPGGLLLSGW